MILEPVTNCKDVDEVWTFVPEQDCEEFAVVVASPGKSEEFRGDLDLGSCGELADVSRCLVSRLLIAFFLCHLLRHGFV